VSRTIVKDKERSLLSPPSSFPPFLLFQATSSLDSSARTLKSPRVLPGNAYEDTEGSLFSLPHSSLSVLQALFSTLISSSLLPPRDLLPFPLPLVLFATPGMIPHSSRTGAVLNKRNVSSSIAALRGN